VTSWAARAARQTGRPLAGGHAASQNRMFAGRCDDRIAGRVDRPVSRKAEDKVFGQLRYRAAESMPPRRRDIQSSRRWPCLEAASDSPSSTRLSEPQVRSITPATISPCSPPRNAKGPGDLRHRGPPGLVAGAGYG
jgi:hypothetical protein